MLTCLYRFNVAAFPGLFLGIFFVVYQSLQNQSHHEKCAEVSTSVYYHCANSSTYGSFATWWVHLDSIIALQPELHFLMLCSLYTANVIILTLMTALKPPQYTINTIETSNDAFGRPRESYGACAYQEQGWFFLALAILNGGILVLSVLQSWHARGLATEFAESKYVFLALASTTVVVFVGAPVLVLARDTPNATLFLGSAINLVCKFLSPFLVSFAF